MSKPVVVGTDGTPTALAAVDWAADEADRRRLPLRVVHAAVWATYGRDSGSLTDSVTHHAWARARSRHPSVAVEAETALRDPVSALLAEGGRAALLVLGSRSLGRLAGALLGSVSLPVVAALPCPVVVVREPPARTEPAGPVVVAVGTRGENAPVTAFAVQEAVLRGCAVHAVHAWQVPRAEAATAHTGQFDDAGNARHEQARRHLDAALAPAADTAESEVRRLLGKGPASEVLVEATAGACLLVIGAHRRDLRSEYRIGPVSRAVLRHAPCPVAVVPHG